MGYCVCSIDQLRPGPREEAWCGSRVTSPQYFTGEPVDKAPRLPLVRATERVPVRVNRRSAVKMPLVKSHEHQFGRLTHQHLARTA